MSRKAIRALTPILRDSNLSWDSETQEKVFYQKSYVRVIMPRVTVKFFGIFSELARTRKEELEFEGKTLQDLVGFMSSKYGRKFRDRVQGRTDGPEVIFAVNGKISDRDVALDDGDEILVSYPVGGG
ncbi:MAG: MoaD/ThiS family protein [Thermoplasmata archaeon]